MNSTYIKKKTPPGGRRHLKWQRTMAMLAPGKHLLTAIHANFVWVFDTTENGLRQVFLEIGLIRVGILVKRYFSQWFYLESCPKCHGNVHADQQCLDVDNNRLNHSYINNAGQSRKRRTIFPAPKLVQLGRQKSWLIYVAISSSWQILCFSLYLFYCTISAEKYRKFLKLDWYLILVSTNKDLFMLRNYLA